jgi:response regulator RpfG family c-di-GMP phosphodiesterase
VLGRSSGESPGSLRVGAEQQQLQQAVQLHDAGKVRRPDAILHKPGPLDDDEWTFVRALLRWP